MLSSCPNLVAFKSGRDVFVSFREDVGAILQNAYAEDADDEGTYLAKAASIVRRKILNCSVRFEGTFDESSQKVSVPKTLVTLLSMIMNGSNLTLETNDENVYKQQPCLSISQLLVYEPPLPVYISLLIHSQTWQPNLVSNLHDLGISISYDHVLEIEKEAAYAMCEKYKTEGVLCPPPPPPPPNLRKTFTTSAYDNIDHNPNSTTAKESFHGTGISIFQHPNNNNSGHNRVQTPFSNSLPKQKVHLQTEYTTLLPVSFLKKDALVPKIRGWQPKDDTYTAESIKIEMDWLNHAVEAMQNGGSVPSSWSAYTTKYATNVNIIKSISSMLPLFK